MLEYPLTKKGGYKEVPQSLILEAGEDVGLDPEESLEWPPVFTVPGRKIAGIRSTESTPSGSIILLPRRQHKSTVPKDLKHEFAHYKLHSGPSWLLGEDRSPEAFVKEELEACLAAGQNEADYFAAILLKLIKGN